MNDLTSGQYLRREPRLFMYFAGGRASQARWRPRRNSCLGLYHAPLPPVQLQSSGRARAPSEPSILVDVAGHSGNRILLGGSAKGGRWSSETTAAFGVHNLRLSSSLSA